jgi:hypothetical protein
MIRESAISHGLRLVLVLLALSLCMPAQSLLSELKAERDPGKRAEKALLLANAAFDSARDYYRKGQIEKGDAALDEMTDALIACLQSAEIAHKAKFFKKAEMDVAALQRRMTWLLNDLDVQDRGWAEITSKKLDEIHDKLLDGVMRK